MLFTGLQQLHVPHSMHTMYMCIHICTCIYVYRSSSASKSLPILCDALLSNLEECLNFDLQLFTEMCPARVSSVIATEGEAREKRDKEGEARREEEAACLPSDLLQKVTSLCMLSSHTLRKKGEYQSFFWNLSLSLMYVPLTMHSIIKVH